MIRILLLAISLTGCASAGEQRIVWHKASDSDLYALCRATDVRGCYWRAGGVCHVVAPDIAQWSPHDLETLGHEVKHCFDASWHD